MPTSEVPVVEETADLKPVAIHGTAGDGYERTDVNVRLVTLFLIGVGLLLGGLQLGVWKILQWFSGAATTGIDMRPTSGASGINNSVPRLQSQPWLDYESVLAEQNTRLKTFGWVSKRDGIVHIPISRAMDILAERGLPVLPEQQIAPDGQIAKPDRIKTPTE